MLLNIRVYICLNKPNCLLYKILLWMWNKNSWSKKKQKILTFFSNTIIIYTIFLPRFNVIFSKCAALRKKLVRAFSFSAKSKRIKPLCFSIRHLSSDICFDTFLFTYTFIHISRLYVYYGESLYYSTVL